MSVAAEDWIQHHATFTPGKEALVDLASGRGFTYGEFHARIDKAALYLRDALGVGENDRVALVSLNDSDATSRLPADRAVQHGSGKGGPWTTVGGAAR